MIHEYSLETDIEREPDRLVTVTDSFGNPVSAIAVNPGENIVLPTTTINNGNGPDRFDFRLTTVTDPTGVPVRTVIGILLYLAKVLRNWIEIQIKPSMC